MAIDLQVMESEAHKKSHKSFQPKFFESYEAAEESYKPEQSSSASAIVFFDDQNDELGYKTQIKDSFEWSCLLALALIIHNEICNFLRYFCKVT